MNKPGNYLHLWARNTRISFFGQNLPFFSIFHTKFKIEKYFTFLHNFCSTPVLINICVGGFMQNFRTLGLIIKKVRDLFNLPDKYGKIIQCETPYYPESFNQIGELFQMCQNCAFSRGHYHQSLSTFSDNEYRYRY